MAIRPRLGSLALAAVSVVSAAACTGPGTDEPEETTRGGGGGTYRPAPLSWVSCEEPELEAAGLQCATLDVPVDWNEPEGPTISLYLSRREATSETERIGTLLLNNGAGGSAVEQLRLGVDSGLAEIGGALVDRFDLVAVDPRGVGRSTPVTCEGPLKPPDVTYFPETREQLDRLVAHNEGHAADCASRSGPVVEHLDLESTARDYEAVRQALGEETLDWYGIDRSALVGRTYTRLFPGRLRTLVLDTALDDTIPPVERLAAEVRAAEAQFVRFATWCEQSTDCALTGQDVAAVYDAVVAGAEENPLPAGEDRVLTGEDIQLATQEFLHISAIYWPELGAAIAAAAEGDASAFTTTPDDTLDRSQALAAACLDTPPAARTLDELLGLQRLVRTESPHLGGAVRGWATLAGCLGRPGPDTAVAITPAPEESTTPALVIQSSHQALAPYSWGHGLATQLPGSVVLTRDGDDYSSFLLSECVRDTVNAYLVTRELPAPGTVCDAAPTAPTS